MVNFEPLDDGITYAVEHPEGIDFGYFFAKTPCGTTACLGGTIAQQAGWRPVWGPGDDDDTSDVEKAGEVRYAREVAADLIGADSDQAFVLFILTGTLNRAIELRNHWAAEAGVPERTWDLSAVTS